jgi:hypothetical protein
MRETSPDLPSTLRNVRRRSDHPSYALRGWQNWCEISGSFALKWVAGLV